MEKLILRLKVFARNYRELLFQLLENGDELYGLIKPVTDFIVLWLDIMTTWII